VGYLQSLNSTGSPPPYKKKSIGAIQAQKRKRDTEGSDVDYPSIKKCKTDERQVQTIIDAGQTDFHKYCECGMFFSPGNEEDEKLHKRFHSSKLAPLTLSGIAKFNTVKNWSEGSIIAVDPSLENEQIKSAIARVDSELNFTYNWKAQGEQMFLYIRNKKILGCVIAENVITTAYKIKQEDKTGETRQGTIVCDSIPQPALIGVSRVWVHSKYRRQGIATSLVDACRNNFLFGEVVQKDKVAITQPTSDGLCWASKYFNCEDFLIYDPIITIAKDTKEKSLQKE